MSPNPPTLSNSYFILLLLHFVLNEFEGWSLVKGKSIVIGLWPQVQPRMAVSQKEDAVAHSCPWEWCDSGRYFGTGHLLLLGAACLGKGDSANDHLLRWLGRYTDYLPIVLIHPQCQGAAYTSYLSPTAAAPAAAAHVQQQQWSRWTHLLYADRTYSSATCDRCEHHF